MNTQNETGVSDAPEQPKPESDLRVRCTVSILFGIVVLGCLFASEAAWLGLLIVFCILSWREWTDMTCKDVDIGTRAWALTALLTVLITARVLGFQVSDWQNPAVLFGVTAGVWAILWRLFRWRKVPDSHLAALIVPYVGLGLASLLMLRNDLSDDLMNMSLAPLFVILVVWATDSGAYLIGRKFGRNKLIPRISPKKTVEGACGGIGAAMLAGLPFAIPFGPVALLLAPLLSVAAQLGDLFESAIKRRYCVKDSGRLLPGHGGVLDRIDGLLVAAPVLYVLMVVTGFSP
ncbi:MAG: phosphatidate cytidylyltransferase [Pseudomonadota bacterium]|nr:phosphatidate cytidylyltransferase [Pseudomonadota bacterium]